jgi:hypothetical protein
MGASKVKWTQKVFRYLKTIVFVQTPRSSRKMLFKLNIFFILTSIVMLSTLLHNTKMRFSRLIIKSKPQKKMASFRFECEFHVFNFFFLFIFPYSLTHYTLEVNIKYFVKFYQ